MLVGGFTRGVPCGHCVGIGVRIEFIFQGGMLWAGCEFPETLGPVSARGRVEIELGLAVEGAAFGCDDDHAIGAAGAVDRGGAGVFEDFDALDIGGVEVGQGRGGAAAGVDSLEAGVVDEYAVDDIQGVIVRVDRGGAADADDDVVELSGGFLQVDADGVEAVDGHLLLLIADIRYYDYGGDVLTGDKGEDAITVCIDFMGRAFEVDRSAYQARAALVGNVAGEGYVLVVALLGVQGRNE